VSNLAEVFETQFPGKTQEELWTFYFAPEQLRQKMDFMFASQALLAKLKDAGIERGGMFDLAAGSGGREQSLATVTSQEDAASDHAAIWADFEFA
jgi:hypothetical protein